MQRLISKIVVVQKDKEKKSSEPKANLNQGEREEEKVILMK